MRALEPLPQFVREPPVLEAQSPAWRAAMETAGHRLRRAGVRQVVAGAGLGRARALLLGHSHGGQVLALLTQLVYPAKTAPALWEALREIGEPLEELKEQARTVARARLDIATFGMPPALRLRDGPALPGIARGQPPGRGAARGLPRGRALHGGRGLRAAVGNRGLRSATWSTTVTAARAEYRTSWGHSSGTASTRATTRCSSTRSCSWPISTGSGTEGRTPPRCQALGRSMAPSPGASGRSQPPPW
jgi:hypothetical protein